MELAPVSSSQHYAFCARYCDFGESSVCMRTCYKLSRTQRSCGPSLCIKCTVGLGSKLLLLRVLLTLVAARVLPLFSPILSRTFEPGVLGVLGTRSKENPALGRWRSPPAGFYASRYLLSTSILIRSIDTIDSVYR